MLESELREKIVALGYKPKALIKDASGSSYVCGYCSFGDGIWVYDREHVSKNQELSADRVYDYASKHVQKEHPLEYICLTQGDKD